MEIRSIKPEDIKAVVKMMRDFAEFEKLGDYFEVTAEKLDKVLFGPQSFVEALVVTDGEKLVGYAIFYPHFASFRGQSGYYLEDIFIDDAYRGHGIGETLLRQVAQIAENRGFERIDFQVLDWNQSAVEFYLRLGAERDESERHFRFCNGAFKTLAS